MNCIMQSMVAELDLNLEKNFDDPFNNLKVKADIVQPDGKMVTVPGFWRGRDRWTVRYSSEKCGIHNYRIICADYLGTTITSQTGDLEIIPYKGENPFYQHGGIVANANKKYLQHRDGKPFFWLGDTWWMVLTKRLDWPDGVERLVKDRLSKGFNIVQLVGGLYPDMEPFDKRGENEAGFPWDKGFKSINPDYFENADRKIRFLADSGMVSCIVGCWGFFLEFVGEEVIEKHWEYLVARYGAFPVVWCVAGEALMDFYKDPGNTHHYSTEEKKAVWTRLCKRIHEYDPFDRIVTIHPSDFGHDVVDDDSVLDLDMLQTGHFSYNSLIPTIKMVKEAVGRKRLPVINSEVCYEGICGTNQHDIQRFTFWTSVLNGACGHTYGANGIWQLNTSDEPYGPSPHGASWGDTPWEDAYRLPGSYQIGLGKKLLEKYEWWRFEPHPEWVENQENENGIGCYASGIPGETRVIYIPFLSGFGWGEKVIKGLEKGLIYKAYYFDPISGEELELGDASGDLEGNWKSGLFTKLQDWILVLERK